MKTKLCALLVCVMTFCTGMAVPAAVEEYGGSIIKTYELAPEESPQLLIEEPFERDGFLYEYDGMTQEPVSKTESKSVSQTVTVESGSAKTEENLALLAGSIGTMIGYAVSKNRRSRWATYVNSVAFLPYLMPSIAVGVAFFILFSTEKLNLFNTYTLLIIVGTVKYIPFASRSSLNSMLQLSGEIEEAAIIQDIPWIKRMTRIIIPIQKSSIISGFLLPFMTCLRELSLFMLLCVQGFILSTTLDYFDEMGLYAFSSGINLILIVTILVCNTLVNKITGASLDKGIGG